MNIHFSLVDENYIKTMVEEGFYTSATELIRDAVRRMREREDSKRDHLLAALELGERDVKAGRTMPYTPALLDQIEQEAIIHAAQGRKPNPDVCD